MLYKLLLRAFALIGHLEVGRNRAIERLVNRASIGRLVRYHIVTPNGLTAFRAVAYLYIAWRLHAFSNAHHNLLLPQSLFQSLLWLFVIATFTDMLDGVAARTFPQYISERARRFGINFDPAVDKILLVILFVYYPHLSFVSQWLVIICAVGECAAVVLRFLAVRLLEPVHSNPYGRAKMCLQFSAVVLLFFCYPLQWPFQFALVSALTLGTISLVVHGHTVKTQHETASKQWDQSVDSPVESIERDK